MKTIHEVSNREKKVPGIANEISNQSNFLLPKSAKFFLSFSIMQRESAFFGFQTFGTLTARVAVSPSFAKTATKSRNENNIGLKLVIAGTNAHKFFEHAFEMLSLVNDFDNIKI